jgi:arabinoxylan arabinofuranohydrolase
MRNLLGIRTSVIVKPTVILLSLFPLFSGGQSSKDKQAYNAYLFTYFTGNSKEGEQIRFALSTDGYHYIALNGNRPVIASAGISSTGGVRDPHILRSADGKSFYMVATDMVSGNGWNSNRAMVLMRSKDLINWTSSIVNIQKRFPGNDSLLRVWAPQTIYDAKTGKYMLYWSMKHGTSNPDKIYYAYANKEFTDIETVPQQLFFSPTNGSCIDGDIVFKNGKYHLFFKTEGEGAGIKIAVSDKLTGGYLLRDRYVQQTTDPVEGAGVFKLNGRDEYILMYDVYTKGKYQFTKTKDLEHFSVIDQEVSMNFHPRHGTIIPITTAEAEKLVVKWMEPGDIMVSARSTAIKKINIVFDSAAGKLSLPVTSGTNLAAFDPGFTRFPGSKSLPATPQNFKKDAVVYSVSIKGRSMQSYRVNALMVNNPVLPGYYADPDILYSEKTKRFYIYPTSDGFTGWSGTYFKTFSSANLLHWKDEGIILDLNKDVSWAKRNAWAPCIAEKKTGNHYKYYFYFTAAQKIGVAVADDPAGPFIDSGKPLVDQYPEGIKRGQQIDPDVFTDPLSGKSYLYWGNSYMAGAELNDDMISIREGSLKVFKTDSTFREGTTVFYRNGKYYFLWSEDDTRSENYRVRYGTADSPLGDISIPAGNLVIAKDTVAGIYATGHNSILQIPGKDEWYIVYHRFNYPNGIKMGRAAGYNREVCIDKMEFNSDGSIKLVKPTHAGVNAITPVKK